MEKFKAKIKNKSDSMMGEDTCCEKIQGRLKDIWGAGEGLALWVSGSDHPRRGAAGAKALGCVRCAGNSEDTKAFGG